MTGIYEYLKRHFNNRKDKNAASRTYLNGWGVGMEGDNVVVGSSSWTQSPRTGIHKREGVDRPVLRVTPDNIISFHPKLWEKSDATTWRPWRFQALLMCRVLGVWERNVRSVASDLLHLGPTMTITIGGRMYGLDSQFSVHMPELGTRNVVSSTPITRLRTNRTAAKPAYALSKDLAALGTMALRFGDWQQAYRGWTATEHWNKNGALVAKELFDAAGGTFVLKPEAHPDLCAKLADMACLSAVAQTTYTDRTERTPHFYEVVSRGARTRLLHVMKLACGYTSDTTATPAPTTIV
jgi:hypothetical protein